VWLHGEAVAAGMVMAADMSVRLGWIEEEILHRTVALLEKAELPTRPPEVPSPDFFGQDSFCQILLLCLKL
jgi:3-dehydroquinate synthase